MQKVSLLAKSSNWLNSTLTTVLVSIPTTKIAQLRTHRTLQQSDYIDIGESGLSISSNSSRAIPVEAHFKNLSENYFIPEWTEKAKGMVGKKIYADDIIHKANELWRKAKKTSEKMVKELEELGIHKQDSALLLSPFTYSNVIITGDDDAWENFFNLRCPKYSNGKKIFYSSSSFSENNAIPLPQNKSTAYPAIQEIAELIYDEVRKIKTTFIEEGNWHVPFGNTIDKMPFKEGNKETLRNKMLSQNKLVEYETVVKPKISASMCAKISFDTFTKEESWQNHLQRAEKLIADHHYSPFEHQYKSPTRKDLKKLTSHYESVEGIIQFSQGEYTSNVKNWVQYRKLL